MSDAARPSRGSARQERMSLEHAHSFPVCIASLTAVTWDFPLIGRTRMLTSAWHAMERQALFVEPPHSYRSLLSHLLKRKRQESFVERPWPTRYPARWWPRMNQRRLNQMMRDRANDLRRMLERRCSLAEMAAIVVSPMWAPWLDAIPFGCVVYDCIDDLSVHAPQGEVLRLYQTWETELIDRCHGAVVTAERLGGRIAARRATLPIATIRNGVDVDAFIASAGGPRPRDLPAGAAAGRPIIGFVGALYEWIDFELIRAAAAQLPECDFVFVGPNNQPSDVESLSRLANVRLLGARPYTDVPAYISAFDICWVPFALGDIAAAANPVKIYEYLALGKPVVTTPVADVASFGALVRTRQKHDDVISVLRACLMALPAADRDERVAFARGNSWSVRAEAYAAFLAKLR